MDAFEDSIISKPKPKRNSWIIGEPQSQGAKKEPKEKQPMAAKSKKKECESKLQRDDITQESNEQLEVVKLPQPQLL